jgi:sugar transferase (PEP-CTERM/EpsH1 system associated)
MKKFDNKHLNILWVSHLVPYPPKGGVLQRSYNLIRYIAERHNVFLIAFNQKILLGNDFELLEAVNALRKFCQGVETVRLPSDKCLTAKYALIFKSFFTKKPYTVNWNLSSEMDKKVNNIISSFDPDIIHYDTIGIAEYFQKNKKIPQVLNHHNIESAMMYRRAKKEKNVVKKIYFYQEAFKIEQYERKVCELLNCNLVVSKEDKRTLKHIAPNAQIIIIENGVDTKYFYVGKQKKEKNILVFAGGMNWYPNRDAMLFFAKEVWPILTRKRPGIKIYIIGMNPPDELTHLSSKDPNLIVTGYVDDVRLYFEKASLYVCPIRDGGGTRLKILDALSSGIPIVATKIAAEGIDVAHEKTILIAETPQEICACIIRLLDDEALSERLALKGRQLVETSYEWSVIGNKLSGIYKGLAN